jgi:c-di-GMP-binding flagellar brake protein YcgR
VTIETIDISAGGAFCRAPEEVPLRSQIRVQIDLPTRDPSPPIVTDAIVLRVDRDARNQLSGFLVGLYFLNLRAEDRQRLQQFIFGCNESKASPD